MTTTRREIVTEGVVVVYRCVVRCVRRSFLCGVDEYYNKNYEPRKDWVRDRLEFLAGQLGSRS